MPGEHDVERADGIAGARHDVADREALELAVRRQPLELLARSLTEDAVRGQAFDEVRIDHGRIATVQMDIDASSPTLLTFR